jgi:hypothetical protein
VSLKSAVQSVVDLMEKDQNSSLDLYILALKTALMAANDPVPTPSLNQNSVFVGRQQMIEDARAEFAKNLQREELGGVGDSKWVELVGDPEEEGTSTPVDASIKEGQMPVINGKIYVYKSDNKLHLCEEETKKMRENQSKKVLVS